MAEYYQQLLGVYGDQMEMGDLDEQLLRAQALRDTAMPEGRNSGRVYTAANPLEFVGAGIKQYRGAKKEQGVNAEREAVRKRIGEAVKQYGAGIPGA